MNLTKPLRFQRFTLAAALLLPAHLLLIGQSQCQTEDADMDDWTTAQGDCNDNDATIYPNAPELCDGLDNDCDREVDEGSLGTSEVCPAADCTEIQDANPEAQSGPYYLNAGVYHCEMGLYEGGWTLVRQDALVYGTGYDGTYYNGEGILWNQVLFQYASGYVSAHCAYPDSITGGCNNLGFQFGGESWGLPLYWGSSTCGLATTDYTGATTYPGGYDFIVSRGDSNETIRLGALEGISSCTIEDNHGEAYVNIYVRR